MESINYYAITFKNGTTIFREVDGSISYNLNTQKFTYQYRNKTHALEGVQSYKLIGHNEDAINTYLRHIEEKKVQKIIDTLNEIKDEIENHYDQDFLAYKLGEIINEIEEKVMPHDYMDNH